MALFALRRLLLAIPLLVGITFVSYVVISLAPGGPLDFLTPEDPNASVEVKERLIQEFGLDQPIHVQYWRWLKRAVRLDFGRSFLPDGRPVLTKIGEHPRYLSALLTGNIEPAARLKVEITGLAEFFQLPGAFGEDSFDRNDLPALAAQRINEYLGADLQPEQFIIIGDTPNDIACARHFGARVVAVATGRVHSADVLREHAPDALLPDLLDAELMMRTLDEL